MRWLTNNPNGPNQAEQSQTLLVALEQAKSWEEAAQSLMEWCYDRKAGRTRITGDRNSPDRSRGSLVRGQPPPLHLYGTDLQVVRTAGLEPAPGIPEQILS
jgi:hypothetical protein